MVTFRDVVVITNSELDILSADDNYREYVCESSADTVFANVHPDDQHLLYEIVETLSVKPEASLCFRVCNKKGEYCWVSANCSQILEGEGENIRIELRDLSDLDDGVKAVEIDYLTGLLNKKAITDYAKGLCAPDGKRGIVNLCIIDIDNFKYINDTYGHSYGDRILKEVAAIIREALGENGKAGRIGGDELMMTIENVDDKGYLRVFLKGIRERVEATHIDENGYPMVTVSMGIGKFPDYVQSYDELFNLADRMLYRAKSRGKNRYVIYNPEIHGPIVNGQLDETAMTVSRATAIDKTRLVLEGMEGLLYADTESVSSMLMKIAATYDLDEVYLFYKDINKSFYGHKCASDSGNNAEKRIYQIVDSVSDIAYIMEPGLLNRFNSNGVLVIDSPGIVLKEFPKALEFFEKNGIKHAFLYRMIDAPFDGYIAMYNTRELSRKFPQPDITDLTYLSKMMEIALKSR